MKPHGYQIDASNSIFDYFVAHPEGNPLLAMPTATGKSVVIAIFLQRIFQLYVHQRVMILTHSRELVLQDYEKLLKVWPGAPAGINSAGLGERNTISPIIFGSIGSVYKHADNFGHVDLVIIDEAHLISPDEETMYQSFFNELRVRNPVLRIIGFTATPWRAGYGLLTEAGLFTDFCFNITYMGAFNWLIHEGYLCPLVPMRTKVQLDTTGVHMRGSDFIVGELQDAVNKTEITVKAVAESLRNGADERKHWLTFCAGVEHAVDAADILNANGISTVAIHSKMPKGERDDKLKGWKEGYWQCATNNNVLCLDQKTEILTAQGWASIDTMTYAHDIAAWDVDGTIEFTKPELIVRRERQISEKMVSVQGRNKDIRVTSNHRMVACYRSRPWRIRPAEELVGKKICLPCSGNAAPHIKNPLNPNWTLSPTELSTEWCHFIGFWLGDGTLYQSKNGGKGCQFSQSMAYPYIVDWFDKLLKTLKLPYSKHVRNNGQNDIVTWCINRGTGRGSQSRETGFYKIQEYLNKEGSELFWGLNQEQLSAILHGFWLADGNHYSGNEEPINGTYICGTQKQLYDLLQALGTCRGYRINIHQLGIRPGQPAHYKVMYKFTWKKADKFQLVNELARFEEPQISERVWCVTSTTGKLVTRRNGKVTIVGNTTGIDFPALDFIMMLRPTASTNLWVQMLGRGTRPLYAPGFDITDSEQRMEAIRLGGKENCLVHDYAGNTARLGPINDPVLPRKKGDKTGDPPIRICENCGMYNHASAHKCAACGYEFPPGGMKIKAEASRDALIIGNEPIVEVFKIDCISYSSHSKLGAPDSMRVSYQCGIRTFNEYVCLEHPGWAGKRAGRWWKEHAHIAPDVIAKTVSEAIGRATDLKVPSHLRVWVNKKYPEIMSYLYEEKDLPTVQRQSKRSDQTPAWDGDDIPF